MRKPKIILSIILLTVFTFNSFAQDDAYQKDFATFWQTINENYAYFDKKQTDWEKVKEIYSPKAKEVKTREQFIKLLEMVLRELYDNHIQLNTNLADSSRLVPSGTDIRAEWKNNKAIITDLRKDFGAEKSGLQTGIEIVRFNGVEVEEAIKSFTGKSLKKIDVEVLNWSLNVLLAGNHRDKRIITAKIGNETKDFRLDEPKILLENISYSSNLEFQKLADNIGYIKINNSLGDNSLIGEFDSALEKLFDTKGLILDLRETPSGGNSTVGRAILSRFIEEEKIFQKHSIPAEEKNWQVKRSWFEIVSPRGKIYKKPLIILVNHWTGSMSEGIAIGFNGMNRAKIVGTKMAGLAGALEAFTLPNTKIRYSFSVEKIFHINGQPREVFVPDVLIEPDSSKNDKIREAGIKELKKEFKK